MKTRRAKITGIIGPRNLASIHSFVKNSNSNARLVEQRDADQPYLYTLEFDHLSRRDLQVQGRPHLALYDYGGLQTIAVFCGVPFPFILRTARRAEDIWLIEGQQMTFALQSEPEEGVQRWEARPVPLAGS